MSCFRLIAAEKARFPISLACRVLGVSRSGFHAWEARAPSERALTDALLSARIRQIHAKSRDSYGARRIHLELRDEGVRVGRKRVERLLRAAGLSGYVKRCKAKTTIRVPGVRVADDLVGRDFNPQAPNRLWASDIKYVATWEGTLYLASVIDCFSRRVVGWSMRDDMQAELVVDALEMAVARRRPEAGLIHHSDQGSPSTLRLSSANACARPGSRSRWVRRATATTTPSAKPSTRHSRRSSFAGAPSGHDRRRGRRCSTGSKPGTTVSGATRGSATAHPSSANATTKGVTACGSTRRSSSKRKQRLPNGYVSTEPGAVHPGSQV